MSEEENWDISIWEYHYRNYIRDYEDWGAMGNLVIALECLQQVIALKQKDLIEKYCE